MCAIQKVTNKFNTKVLTKLDSYELILRVHTSKVPIILQVHNKFRTFLANFSSALHCAH